MSQERIIAAALYYGAILSLPPPARHHTIITTFALVMGLDGDSNSGADDLILKAQEQQGFLTSTGRYVNRVEGFYIAQQAKQLLRNTSGRPELFSEDMW